MSGYALNMETWMCFVREARLTNKLILMTHETAEKMSGLEKVLPQRFPSMSCAGVQGPWTGIS